MIRWKQTKGDRTTFGIGLSEENIKRLKKGQPIHFNGEQYGFPGIDFVIHYGKTEQLMYAEMRAAGAIGDDTQIKDEITNRPLKQ